MTPPATAVVAPIRQAESELPPAASAIEAPVDANRPIPKASKSNMPFHTRFIAGWATNTINDAASPTARFGH